MPGNSFGEIFRITTFGESHGNMLGVVIDGVPSGLKISESDLLPDLLLRKPGRNFVSKRNEKDVPEIVSGFFNGRTTGAPLTIIFKNVDVDSSYYEEIKYKPRPSHVDLPAIMKYGLDNVDYRGGGRFGGRETVARVAAGAVAKKILSLIDVYVSSCVFSLGNYVFNTESYKECLYSRKTETRTSEKWNTMAKDILEKLISEKDSIGGVVRTFVHNVPPGLGEPVFRKLKADLAAATISIPGSTYFEIGEGMNISRSKGSEVMDSIEFDGKFVWKKNISGGILGGISNGMDIYFNVGFKPTGSISRVYRTVDLRNNEETELKIQGRHDPSIVIRAVAVVEAMAAIVILDHAMINNLIPRVIDESGNEKIERNFKNFLEGKV